jgi:hypothetical protein
MPKLHGGWQDRNKLWVNGPRTDQTRIVMYWYDEEQTFMTKEFNTVATGGRVTQDDLNKLFASLSLCPNYHTSTCACACSYAEFHKKREEEFKVVIDKANKEIYNAKEVNFVVGPSGAYLTLEITFMAK